MKKYYIKDQVTIGIGDSLIRKIVEIIQKTSSLDNKIDHLEATYSGCEGKGIFNTILAKQVLITI